MTSTELDKLLIDHLADLDDAIMRVGILDAKVTAAIDGIAEEWAAQNGWVGLFNWKREIAVAPPEWRPSEDDWRAWFSLWFGHGDTGKNVGDEDRLWLTRLCRVGRGQVGFRFGEKRTDGTKERLPRKFIDSLRPLGFIIDEGGAYYLPFNESAAVLANAVRDGDIERGLLELRKALDVLVQARPHFDELLSSVAIPASSSSKA